MVTADRVVSAPEFHERAGAVLDAGGGGLVLHLRARVLTGRDFHELALSLRSRAEGTGAALAINDRVDVALATGITGVHLGGASMAPRDARSLQERLSRPSGDLRIGRSIHSVDELSDAVGVDYWMAGNVFETPSHPAREGRGLDWIAGLSSAAERPVFAIGGITPDRVEPVLRAGAAGVAVLSGVWDAGDPADAVSRYLERLEAHPG